jgi:hypothetical protein
MNSLQGYGFILNDLHNLVSQPQREKVYFIEAKYFSKKGYLTFLAFRSPRSILLSMGVSISNWLATCRCSRRLFSLSILIFSPN